MSIEGSQIMAVDSEISIKAKFVVYDEYAQDTTERKTFSFDLNATQRGLRDYVANLLGYQADSFDLLDETNQPVSAEEDPLTAFGFRAQGLNKLYLRERDAGPKPVRVAQPASDRNALLSDIKSKRQHDSDDEAPSKTSTGTSGYGYGYNYNQQSETGFVGLANQGATCYLNSVLQTLFMTPEFRNALYDWRPPAEGTSIATELQRLFVLLQTSKSRSVETKDLTKSFGWDSGEAFQQHDVQELMRVLFEALEKQWAGTDKASLVDDLYQGEMRDFVQCKECGYESARGDKFQDIPLVLRAFGATKTVGSIEEALAKFVETEQLEKDNQYSCSKCNKKVDALKGLKLVRLPYLLTLQLKRFDFDVNTFQRIKLHDRVTFPLKLDMKPFLSTSSASVGARASEAGPAEDAPAASAAALDGAAADEPLSHASADSAQSSVDMAVTESTPSSTGVSVAAEAAPDATARAVSEAASEDDPSCCCIPSFGSKMKLEESDTSAAKAGLCDPVAGADGNQYELFSIMVHSGSALGGHYYAYIKSLENGKWYWFNDSSVSEITEDSLEKTFGGSTSTSYYYYSAHSTSAYMLMYRRIDPARNRNWYTAETMPPHVKEMLVSIASEEQRRREEEERKARETTLTVVFMHDGGEKSVELTVPKLTTITELTEIAHKDLELDRMGVPLENVRLRRFRYGRVPGELFTGKENKTLTELSLIWGVTTIMMEACRPDGTFQEYDPNGIAPDVYVCDYATKTLSKIPIIIGDSRRISDLKAMVAAKLDKPDVPLDRIFVFKTPYQARDVTRITSDVTTLYEACIYSASKVGVCIVPEGTDDATAEEEIRKVLIEALNSIVIKVGRFETPDEEGKPVTIDQRMTLRDFKRDVLAPLVGLPISEFKVYKPAYYSGRTPIELTQGDDSMSLCLSSYEMKILYQKGRAAGEGEVLLETYLCDFTDPAKPPLLEKIGEFPFTAESNNALCKKEFLAACKQLREANPEAWKYPVLNDIDAKLLRMRDINAYGDGPTCGYYGETSGLHLNRIRRICFQVLTKPDPEVMNNHTPLFLRRWHPDTNTWGPLEEILISDERYNLNELYGQITALSGIPREAIMIARGPSFFPFEKTALEADALIWHGELFRLSEIAYGSIDGYCLLYKDRRTPVTPLTAEERERLTKEAASKKKAQRTTYYGKERALKITASGPAASQPASTTPEGGSTDATPTPPPAPPLPKD